MSLKTNNHWVVLERDPVVLGDWTGRCLDPGVFALGASLSMVVRRLGHEIGRSCGTGAAEAGLPVHRSPQAAWDLMYDMVRHGLQVDFSYLEAVERTDGIVVAQVQITWEDGSSSPDDAWRVHGMSVPLAWLANPVVTKDGILVEEGSEKPHWDKVEWFQGKPMTVDRFLDYLDGDKSRRPIFEDRPDPTVVIMTAAEYREHKQKSGL
jgi:hypothetical protein